MSATAPSPSSSGNLASRVRGFLAAGALAALVVLLAPGTADARARVALSPVVSTPSTLMTFSGSGYAARTNVQLLIGPANSEASLVATQRASTTGRVRFRLRLSSTAPAGSWVALMCQRSCATKAQAPFRIVNRVTFLPGQGAQAARLGMTRALVVRRLGPPTVNMTNYLSWQPSGAMLDAYMTNGTARSYSVMGRRYCTTFGFCIGDTASVLQAQYGAALVQHEAIDERTWVVTSTYGGAATYTAYVVSDFAATTRVTQAWIGYCDDADYC